MTITSNRKRYSVKHLTLVKCIQNRCMDIYEYLLDANRLKLNISKSEHQELQTKEISCCDKLSYYVDYEFVHSLGLELNGKTQIISFKNGIKFCGFHTYVTSNGKVIRKLKNENKRAVKKKFKKMVGLVKCGKLSEEKFYNGYNVWKNYISHGNGVKLGYGMDRYVEGLFD